VYGAPGPFKFFIDVIQDDSHDENRDKNIQQNTHFNEHRHRIV